jgi:hypothetical protein
VHNLLWAESDYVQHQTNLCLKWGNQLQQWLQVLQWVELAYVQNRNNLCLKWGNQRHQQRNQDLQESRQHELLWQHQQAQEF